MLTRKHLQSQSGSVLLWTLGMVLLSTLAINLSFSITRAVQIQHRLQNATDAALFQAANQLDVDTFYATGDLTEIQLSSNLVRQVIRQALAEQHKGYQISSLKIDSNTAVLQTQYKNSVWDLAGVKLKVDFHATSSIELYADES